MTNDSAGTTRSTATVGGGDFGMGGGESGPAEGLSRIRLLRQNWWLLALRGALGVVFGLVALMMPAAAMLSLAIVFGAYLAADGILGIVAAVKAARREDRWGLLLAEGVVNIIVGILALVFPVGAVLAFVFMTSAWALITGVLMIAAAVKLDAAHGRWWLALSGVASVVFGVLLAISPLLGAVVLTWWLGTYGIVFGVMLLVLAFRLRARLTAASAAARA